MVLSRYRAPVVAPPNFVPVDTAKCRTQHEISNLRLREDIVKKPLRSCLRCSTTSFQVA